MTKLLTAPITTDLLFTDNQKQLLLDAFNSDDLWNYIDDEFQTWRDNLYPSDLLSILEEPLGLYHYSTRMSGEGLVKNVKTSIGWKNNPSNYIEQSVLEKYIARNFNDSFRYQTEFEHVAECYSHIGKLICCGRSGGYWGFEEINFKHYVDGKLDYDNSWEIKFDVDAFIKYIANDFDYYNQNYFHITHEDFYIDEDTGEEMLSVDIDDIASMMLQRINFEEEEVIINPLLIEAVEEFKQTCENLVDYFENCNNLLEEIDNYCYDIIDDYFDIDYHFLSESFGRVEFQITCQYFKKHYIAYFDKALKTVSVEADDDLRTCRWYDDIIKNINSLVMEEINSRHTYLIK